MVNFAASNNKNDSRKAMKTISRTRALVLSLMLSFAALLPLAAVPTNQRPFRVTQKDGTTLQLRFMGDENFHYYCTMDGAPLVRVDDAYYHAESDGQGGLRATRLLAHEATQRDADELQYVSQYREPLMHQIRQTWSARLQQRNEQLAAKMDARRVRRNAFGHPTHLEGQKKGLVILVNYADRNMLATSSQAAWHSQFNDKGYSKNNHYGSVRDYFRDQSYGMLDIDFDVVGPYTVSQGWRYYGKQSNGSDVHPCQLVSEACRLADDDVDFRDYDWDGDGEVEQVFVIYAGYSAAAGYDEDAIWPHEWHLNYGAYYGDGTGALKLDGVWVDNYAVSSELNGTSGTRIDNIGVAVHEFSHCLGLPDFYDVDGKGTQCMDYWDVLDQGCYSGPNWGGEVPTGYSAYERHFAGWLNYEELTDPCRVTGMANLGDEPKAYIHYNKGHRNEYFILENRQAKGWFKYPVSAHGLLVYHVDYDAALWEGDRPNSDPQHPRMTFVPADNSFDRSYTDYMVADFFPGTKNVRSLTNTSHEKVYGRMFNKNSDGTYHTNMELTSITESMGKIGFVYNGGEAGVKSQLNALIKEVQAMLEVPFVETEEGASLLLQAAIQEASDVAATSATSAEYSAAMTELRRKAVDFLFVANPADADQPFDISFVYINPDITSNEGWKDELANNGFDYATKCGEYTNMKFTLTQNSLLKLPKGDYTATCQAFQRAGTFEQSADNQVNALFMARTKTQRIHNIVDDAQATRKSTTDSKLADGTYVPSSGKYANNYFRSGLYTNSIDFSTTLLTGTNIKLGIKCTMAKADYWTCFNNFRLYFRGDPDVTAIQHITADHLSADAAVYDLSGRRVSNPQQLSRGIYIVGGRKVLFQ